MTVYHIEDNKYVCRGTCLTSEDIKKYLLSQSEEMQFLRQSSPFAGSECIPDNIRMRIIKKYYSRAEHEQSAS